ncbi:MAG: pyridoxine 5'-phosphate synthase [Leptospiraceae bacterium]|nr:MAG: pyridoxine 5'-phosphate synthase [Leptospiraceae bacterium]
MPMRSLSVNLDHIATIREARKTNYPSITTAAGICEVAGADGITLHLREDRRHIKDRDLEIIREITLLPLTLEMAPTDEMLEIALKNKPDAVTLVPERRMEITTEGGLDLTKNQDKIKFIIDSLKKNHIKVCLFLEPIKEQIQIAKELNADAVEIHTGRYANLFDRFNPSKYEEELNRIKESAVFGKNIGLQMNAGHGIHYHNVRPLAKIEELSEFSIGHSIVSRSIFVGLERAIREMAELIRNP